MGGEPKLISIREAMNAGTRMLRKPVWVDPEDHLEIPIIFADKGVRALGPWMKLWSPGNDVVGNKNPHSMLSMDFDWDHKEWLPWKGTDD